MYLKFDDDLVLFIYYAEVFLLLFDKHKCGVVPIMYNTVFSCH